jgi:hypothetical protein
MNREELLEYLTLEISDDIQRQIKYFYVLFGSDAEVETRKCIEEEVLRLLFFLEQEKVIGLSK